MNNRHRAAVLGLGAILVALSAGAATNDALLGHWPMSEGQGYILKDVAGQVGDGEMFGAEWVPLGKGFCLKLGAPFKEGIDLGRPKSKIFKKQRGAEGDGFAFARLPLNNLCVLGNQGKLRQMTLALWVKPVNGGVADPKQGTRANVWSGGNFFIRISESNLNWTALVVGGYTAKKVTIEGSAMDGTKWTHLALMHDEVFARFFVDGKEMGTDKGPYLIANLAFPPSEKRGSYGMYVGMQKGFAYAGFVDDIKLYNRVFTEAEIQAEYQSGLAAHGE